MAFDALGVNERINFRSVETPRDRLEFLADFVEGLSPERFYMGRWVTREDMLLGPHCGTAVCLGGWIGALFSTSESVTFNYISTGNLVGLDQQTSRRLFFPDETLQDGTAAFECRDGKKAAWVIRNYLSTGEVRWDLV